MYQQLPVTILLDTSASMAMGSPAKFAMAQKLAASLAYVALAGNDRVRLGAFSDGTVEWFRVLESARRAPALFDWLAKRRPDGHTGLADAARMTVERIVPGGLLILLSDLMMQDFSRALRLISQVEQELIVVQIVAPDDIDPSAIGAGELTLVDSETGREVDVSIDAEMAERYRAEFERWQDEQRALVVKHSGRFFVVSSDRPVERVVLRDWRVAGLIV
jgi:uncharacterized protein (DUF58 family)